MNKYPPFICGGDNYRSESEYKSEMDADKSQKKIKLLKILAEGCRKHPAYRARRPATGRCEECMILWKARLQLQRSTQGTTFQ